MFLYIIISFVLSIVALFIGAGYYLWRDKITVDAGYQSIAESNIDKRLRWYPETVTQLLSGDTSIAQQEIYDRMRSFKRAYLINSRRAKCRATWLALLLSLSAGFGWTIPVSVFSLAPFNAVSIIVFCVGLLLMLLVLEYRIYIVKKKTLFRGRYRAEKRSLFVPVDHAVLTDFTARVDEDLLADVLKADGATSVCFIHLLKAWSLKMHSNVRAINR